MSRGGDCFARSPTANNATRGGLPSLPIATFWPAARPARRPYRLGVQAGLHQRRATFDPVKGELIETIHVHLNAAFGIAFSPDGRRLISASGGREAVKLWDVGTRQELLTLGGTGSFPGEARWSADGDVILAGAPWQTWRAPSWPEIDAAEAKEKAESKQP